MGQEHYAKIIDDEPNGVGREFRRFEVYGSSRTTDRDDAETVYGCAPISGRCYDSMRFANRYQQREESHDFRSGGGEFFITSRTMQKSGGSVSFAFAGKTVGVSLDIEYVADRTTSTYYQYTVPAGSVYSMDYLGPKGVSAIAWCDDGRSGNCA